MTPEQYYFIGILRDYVHQSTTEEPAEAVDWDTVARYAAKQDVSGIVYYQSRGLPGLPGNVAKALKEGFFSDVYLSVNTDDACSRVMGLFDQEGIEYMPFKGMLIRDCYPHPELRTMGDRDILIHHDDRSAADAAILSLGYQRFVDNQAVWTYGKKLLVFEIHDVMFYEDLANRTDYREYFSHIWETASAVPDSGNPMRRVPRPEMHFLYIIAHTAKHVINKGVGFRAFLDMAFFARDSRERDWDWIRTELERLGLFEFTKACFTLCEEWFDVEMPFHREDPDPAWVLEMTEKVFRDGVFGLENKENAASKSAKEIRRSDKPYRETVLRLTLRRLFPPYEDMQLIPWYAWVDGKPWLLPAAWVYRWFYVLKYKRKAGRDLLLEPYEKKETIENRQRYLQRWGL